MKSTQTKFSRTVVRDNGGFDTGFGLNEKNLERFRQRRNCTSGPANIMLAYNELTYYIEV